MDETTARKLLSEIDEPTQPALQELQETAIDSVETVLSDAGFPIREEVCRRLSYTYYYDWETDDPDIVLLVQDPGNLHERHLSELRPHNPLAGECSPREQIGVYREFGKSWLTGRNADFTERFFETLASHGLISLPNGWHHYVASGDFYRDFYLGDVVKYRVDGFGTAAERASYQSLLERELRALDPELVITFGGNAWPALRRSTTPVPVVDTNADPDSIMSIHGTLHQISKPIDAHVLPLAHMSGQVWWRFPPDEYISRLSEALEVFERR
ncbi:Uracil DNA glycosylase superfamily protein [Halorubrum aquaticum]|uniref:Uracil DNA glycosylase superfamily protein n=1 Tax=Halorubrum aquaticum TaxID=387340 RepID=A0A1I2Z8S6_9EURY|nr:uracil-DNA glycosylase family protein [Halorubrum aquaticum]SFH34263.1 Uracil DNA glycosylase superfamily protein [Halorubrum aquaticum]